MDNNYIDEMVRDSIGEFEMAFNPADWDVMEEHLEQDNRVRRKLYVTKAIEACLMLVTVWTIMQFIEIDNSANYQPPLIENQETVPASVNEGQTAPLEVKGNQKKENSAKPTIQQNELNPMLKNVPIANNVFNSLEIKTSENKIEASEVKNNKKSVEIDFKKIIDETNAIPIASLEAKMFDVTNRITKFPETTPSSIIEDITGEDGSQKSKARNFRIGGFVAGDAVSINTPDNYLVAKKAHLLNASGGVMIDRKLKEKLKIETGVVFAYRKHSERSFDIGAAYDVTMENATINTSSIEIPVNVLYEICSNEKNAIYALGGLSNHFALTVKKEAENYAQLNGNATPSLQDQLDGFTSSRSEGLLATKEVSNNHFASANVGAGYERKLNERISLFAQATFKKGFGKLGFHDDDITTVSLSAGVKSIL